jgi:predicted TIM-barrel fold metal-dependent hydrolase
MKFTRRDFLRRTTCTLLGTAGVASGATPAQAATGPAALPIVDTHQHLWDRVIVDPPWLRSAPDILNQDYTTREYLEASRGLNVVQAVYMEVDVAPARHVAEAEHVIELCRRPDHPTAAAVIGGRPASPGFGSYLRRFKDSPYVKGVRQVLHSAATRPGYCLDEPFVRGIRLLGELGLRFDVCMRPAELQDGIKLVELCPDTRFIVDHCGNADPRVFRERGADTAQPSQDADAWRRRMEGFGKRENVICKISGIVARAPQPWTAEDLAPIVNHCLDVFGPDRVVFGSDWPVCLRGASYRQWVDALRAIVAERPLADQRRLWHDNAVRFYGLRD